MTPSCPSAPLLKARQSQSGGARVTERHGRDRFRIKASPRNLILPILNRNFHSGEFQRAPGSVSAIVLGEQATPRVPGLWGLVSSSVARAATVSFMKYQA